MDNSIYSIKSNINYTTKNSNRFINKIIRRIFNQDLIPLPYKTEMVTLEQLNNIVILIRQIVSQNIAGEIVELGSFTGTTAAIIQEILSKSKSNKQLHIFDSFESRYHLKNSNPQELLIKRFESFNLQIPIIHKGIFENTLPIELPNQIAFAHIDCGTGINETAHAKIIEESLFQIYHKLSKGAVCLLMDYHDIKLTIKGFNNNKGVKLGCDKFLKDKPEEIVLLYGGYFSHAYFIKS